MYKTISVIAVLALLASVVPITQAEENYAERNIQWLQETYPDIEIPQEALDAFGERTERADLAAVTSGASHLAGNYVGDVWIVGFTTGCPADNVIAPGHGQYVPADEQLYLYEYPVQQVTAAGGLTVVGWTTKDVGAHSQAQIVGVTDNWCFEFFGLGLYAPYINGVVSAS